MKQLGNIFRSPAQTELLRVLMVYPAPTGLRQAARLAGVYPRSAELVMKALESEGLVLCERRKGRNDYRMNRQHMYYPLLEDVFRAAEDGLINAHRKSLNNRAAKILPFITKTSKMLKKARGDRKHVT